MADYQVDVVVDGRRLAVWASSAAHRLLADGHVVDVGVRRWVVSRAEAVRLTREGWHQLGVAESGERLLWRPLPASPARVVPFDPADVARWFDVPADVVSRVPGPRPAGEDLRRARFDAFVREHLEVTRPTSAVVRTRLWVWRWWAVLLCGGQEVERVLCLTRAGAVRRGARMVRAELGRIEAELRAAEAEVFGG